MLRATGCPGATPGESVPTKDAPQFRSGRVTHPIGHDTGWTTARSQDEVGTNSAQERQYSPVMAALFRKRCFGRTFLDTTLRAIVRPPHERGLGTCRTLSFYLNRSRFGGWKSSRVLVGDEGGRPRRRRRSSRKPALLKRRCARWRGDTA